MSPRPILFFAMSLLVAGLVAGLLVAGFGVEINSVGPAALLVLGAGWQLWMEWLRDRLWLRYRNTGFVPGTQHLVLLGTLGCFACTLAAIMWLMLVVKQAAK
jgi:hypothetical protein